jgi:ATP-binding cassette, subfamily B, bacterial
MRHLRALANGLSGFWRIAGQFWPYVGKELPLIGGALLALFAEVLLRLLEPWPLKLVFDLVLMPERGGDTQDIPIIGALDAMVLLPLLGLAVVAIVGLRALAAYYSTVGFALIGNRVLTRVRSDLFNHLQALSLSFHSRARGGDLTLRIIGDVGMLKEVAVTALLPLLGNTLILISMMALMFWLNRELALAALVIVPLFWLSASRLTPRIREVARAQRKRESAMAATAAESMGAIKIVQAFSLESTFAESFSSQNKQSLKDGVKAKRLEASLGRTVDVLIALGTALVLWYGAILVLRNTLSPGDLLVFLAYLKSAFKPLQDLAKYTGRLSRATAAGERVLEVLGRSPDVRDMPGAVSAPALRGDVEFEAVSFVYERSRPILVGIDLHVHAGQKVAIVGPSGSGKSTLTSLILRLYDPAVGCVTVGGRDIREYTLASLRRQVSIVLQDNGLFATSVRDNISYGVDPDLRNGEGAGLQEEVRRAAILANAHDFIEALPEGYDTVLGERGVTLSHGQRQRIAIARAAMRRAPILILDEPTTGLDEENQRAVLEALNRLAEGRTTFFITHDLQQAAGADLILFMENGRIVERGTHEQLLQANGRYAATYRLQSTVDAWMAPEELHAVAR